MPAETSLAICSVIFGGVLDRLPELKICFAHGGGSFPGTLARIEKGYHARPALCGVNGCSSPREYTDRFYLDTLVHDSSSLDFLIDIFGTDRLALGTDYPFPLGEDHPGKLIEQMESLTDEQKQRMLGGTALDFLGLESSVFQSDATGAS